MAKVIARLLGGLGNQLFVYSAARRLSLVSGAELVLDNVSGYVTDKYGRGYELGALPIAGRIATPAERIEPFSKVRRYVKRNLNRLRPFERRNYILQSGQDFDARLLDVRPRGDLYLEGYWQSEKYFKDVEATIRADLAITPPSGGPIAALAGEIKQSPSVAIHVRFFDETLAYIGDYYARAIDWLQAQVPSATWYVFSDRPDMVSRHVPLPAGRGVIVGEICPDNRSVDDLWLMSLCDHFVITNSTFSWWGAWLGQAAGKQVVAPDPARMDPNTFHGYWRASELLPADWVRL